MNEKVTGMFQTALCRLTSRAEPDPHVWIFSSTDNRHFNYNSKYLFLYVREHEPEIRPRFVINDDELRRKLNERYGPDQYPCNGKRDYFIETKTREGIRTVLDAGVWFTSAGLPIYGACLQKAGKGRRRIINLWHGVPLKTIALSDRSESSLSRIYFRSLFSDNYTDVVATSKAVSRVLQKGLGVAKDKMRIWGQPRCDCLFESFDKVVFFRKHFPDLEPYLIRKAVLYAPTYRSGKAVRLFPFADFNREKLEHFLQENGIFLFIRMHIAEKNAEPLAESEHIRFLNEDKLEDITEGLQAFDALITDYSSIYIDYLLLDRPVIFLPYDLEDYRRTHGFAFRFEKVTPGPKPETMEEFLEALSGGPDADADAYAMERQVIRKLFYERSEPCCAKICEIVKEGRT